MSKFLRVRSRITGLAFALAVALSCFGAQAAFAAQHDYETGLTGDATPIEAASAELAWSYNYQGSDAWAPAVSTPLVIDGDVYLASSSQMRILDQATGAEKAVVDLPAAIDYGARCAYVEGKVLVPLTGGSVVALEPGTLATVWTSDPAPQLAAGAQQVNSSLSVIDGRIYVATVVPSAHASSGGNLMCLDAATGETLWTQEETAGYYWAAACEANGFAVIGADSGIVRAIASDSATGDPVSTLDLGTGVRSSAVADGNDVYIATMDGVLHRISVADDGTLAETGSAEFGDVSTSTPVVTADSVIVGGGVAKSAGYGNDGVLAIVDKADMSVMQVKTVDGKPLAGEVKSRPLVSVQASGTYVYFTANGAEGWPYTSGGDLIMYKVGDTQATSLFDPEGMNNWCMASVALGDDGMLLYTNDSGNLFAVKAKASVEPGPDPDQGGSGDGSGSGDGDGSGEGGNGSGSGSGEDSGSGDGTGDDSGAGAGGNADSEQQATPEDPGADMQAGADRLPSTGDATAPLAFGLLVSAAISAAGVLFAVRRAS